MQDPGSERRRGGDQPEDSGRTCTGEGSETPRGRESVRRSAASGGGERAPARRATQEVGGDRADRPGSRRGRSARREPPWQPRPRANKRGNAPIRRATDPTRHRGGPGARGRKARADATPARPGARPRPGSRSSSSTLVEATDARRPSRAKFGGSISSGGTRPEGRGRSARPDRCVIKPTTTGGRQGPRRISHARHDTRS